MALLLTVIGRVRTGRMGKYFVEGHDLYIIGLIEEIPMCLYFVVCFFFCLLKQVQRLQTKCVQIRINIVESR